MNLQWIGQFYFQANWNFKTVCSGIFQFSCLSCLMLLALLSWDNCLLHTCFYMVCINSGPSRFPYVPEFTIFLPGGSILVRWFYIYAYEKGLRFAECQADLQASCNVKCSDRFQLQNLLLLSLLSDWLVDWFWCWNGRSRAYRKIQRKAHLRNQSNLEGKGSNSFWNTKTSDLCLLAAGRRSIPRRGWKVSWETNRERRSRLGKSCSRLQMDNKYGQKGLKQPSFGLDTTIFIVNFHSHS